MQDEIEAIRRLKARYFRLMDTKDWEGMRQVFADDVVIDTSAAGGDVVSGADEFMAFLRDALGDAVTVHQGHMPEIDLTSDTTATGDLGAQRHRHLVDGDAPRRVRPLPRDLREVGRRVADQVVQAHPVAHRLRHARGSPDGHGGHHRGGVWPRPRVRWSGARRWAWTSPCSTSTATAPPPRRPGSPTPTACGTLGLPVDVADAASVDAAAAAVVEGFGGADLVVSNVGVQLFGSVEAFTDDEWRWLLDVNVTGSARVARAFIPLLRQVAARSSGVHDVVVDHGPGEQARRLPGEQVRRVGPGRDTAPGARRRRHRACR